MPLANLSIIGESINDSVPATHRLFEEGNIDGIIQLARTQDEKGAAYIDVNVGLRTPAFMADMVSRIQQVTAKPLSIDTPDPAIAEAGLAAYDPARAGGRRPILNSISPLRLTMFDLFKKRPFVPILLVSERLSGGATAPCRTAQETFDSGLFMLDQCREHMGSFTPLDCIIDPGIAPLGSDFEGNLKRLLSAMEMFHGDRRFNGAHFSVGLSNFTVMLPSRKSDGSPVKGPLESAFLTLAMPLGLDTVIGSASRKYERLEAGHPALTCLQDFLELEGYDGLGRVQEFYG